MSVTFISHVPEALSAMERAKATALEIIGGKAESYAKKLCPVDTGNLRNSITHQQYDEDTEVIGTNVEYAPYVELGTTRMRARPYLRPAATNHSDEYKALMEAALTSGQDT